MSGPSHFLPIGVISFPHLDKPHVPAIKGMKPSSPSYGLRLFLTPSSAEDVIVDAWAATGQYPSYLVKRILPHPIRTMGFDYQVSCSSKSMPACTDMDGRAIDPLLIHAGCRVLVGVDFVRWETNANDKREVRRGVMAHLRHVKMFGSPIERNAFYEVAEHKARRLSDHD